MTRQEEANESRKGLLRKSIEEEAYRSSSDSLDGASFDSDHPLSEDAKPPADSYQTTQNLANLRKTFNRRSKFLLILLVAGIIFWSMLAAGGYYIYTTPPPDGLSPPWYPTPQGGTSSSWAESYAKAAKLVERMSLVEKVNVTTGTGWMMGLAVGNTGPASSVRFPGLSLQDGPLGIRNSDHATAFPAGITVGATWNKELMYIRGKSHGKEARLKGVNVLLGPCVGPLGRMPAGGRNWEGFGTDPYLQGVAAAETIKGIQSEGIMATIKHYIGNEQEHFRQAYEWALPNALSSNIGDRTLHELYLWPFADAVRAGVASVMCSYQMTNNSYSCGNSKLLNGILKDELGFQGFVQSDWLAQRSGVGSALAGLDMSMPGDGLSWQDGKSLWGPELTKSVLNGSIPMSRLNDMVTRVVAAWYQLGQDNAALFNGNGPNFSSWTKDKLGYINAGSPDDQDLVVVNQYLNVQGIGKDAHSIIARKVAAEGIVLLKNEGKILPLRPSGWPDGGEDHDDRKFRVGIFGEDAGEGQGPNHCPDRGCNQGTLGSGWGSGAADFPYLIAPIDTLQKAFDLEKVSVSELLTNSPPMKSSSSVLDDQDLCLVFVNADSGEGFLSDGGIRGDRNDLFLQKGGDQLVTEVAKGCGRGYGKTIVVIHSVGPVVVEKWIDLPGVKALVWANLPGQESGNSLVDILFGKLNPSGKLPYTIGKSLDDYGEGAKVLYFPNSVIPQQNFSEGLYIDYRYFDKYDIEPRFEFGYGQSYTSFEYTMMLASPMQRKSRLPSPRPDPSSTPPTYNNTIPDASTALLPLDFKKLTKFIYPYIENLDEIKKGPFQYPKGYDVQETSSQAGGGEGGNPSLYEIYVNVGVNITNTGPVAGAEVVQLYLSYPETPDMSTVPCGNEAWKFDTDMNDFPVKVLRGFEKVYLEPSESRRLYFNLTRRDLSYWDVNEQNWVMRTGGAYIIRVGSSSRDLRLQADY